MTARFLNNLMLYIAMSISIPSAAVAETPAQEPMWPGASYDPAIPTFEKVLGFSPGERISNYHQIQRYFEALQEAAPDRIKLQQYATSWEGRALIYVAIGKPENLASLDSYSTRIQALADPRKTNKTQAQQLINILPAGVWLQYGVHGNEISSTDAAMFLAYHLLAAQNDAITQQIMDNTIVFIDPLQNPDGRARFTSRYYATVGLEHSGDRLSAEQNEPWPRGRSNHYLFDMNRDWLAATQPETKGRIAAINTFKPQVIVDVHEMGGDQTYYFAPAAKPFNPHMTATQIANMDEIGRNHAKHFDALGFDYFTREIFDAFYPGYGDSWPTFYGASASTYEVGSARGHVFHRRNGEVLTYRDTVQMQFVASLSTAEGTAIGREKLLNDFYQYQLDAIEEGKDNDARTYILTNEKNRHGTHRLATLMAEHGAEVKLMEESFKACGRNFKAGSYVIDTAQPRGKFVTTVFAEQVDMSAEFIAEQERRRARNLGDQIYDVTGWSLPMMFNVDTIACDKAIKAKGTFISPSHALAANVTNMDAKVGFIVPWGDMAAGRFLTHALRAGISLKSADEAFVLEGKRTYPAGSLIIERSKNKDDLNLKIQAIAEKTGAIVEGTDSSWVTKGPSFGSDKTVTMNAPKVAIAWDTPTSSLSAGNTRFVIERQLGYPVTAIRVPILARADLSGYDVIILPEGYYGRALGQAGADNLQDWVSKGGVLIALGSANRFLADEEYALLDVKRELAHRNDDDNKAPDDAESDDNKVEGQLFTSKDDLSNAIIEAETSPSFVAGVLANVEVDQEHWLTAGVDENLVTVAYGSDIYTPIKLDSGKNLVWFSGPEDVLASGYLWAENKAQLAYKPVLIHQPMGRGMVIGYTQSPTFRAYLEGMNVLLTNSIFRASAHTKN
ncbi:peptidase M14 [Alteromonas sediminis]|uniref:Peptidase M14 n=1 Tax=Alteromonas sediminis TaxID=2259342 RepID=A0A3N5YEC0_9ALTE|nr:M14 family metallopeptidase [Alteromonas sediminis]RPJ68035.1 peptidase M14 [Alteromonas sediminis]